MEQLRGGMQHGVTSCHRAGCNPASSAPPTGSLAFPPQPHRAADGYCRSRVAQFDAGGKWVRDFTVPKGQGPELLVPHRWVPWLGWLGGSWALPVAGSFWGACRPASITGRKLSCCLVP